MNDIVKIVCAYYGIPTHRLYTNFRQKQDVVIAKQMCYLLIREFIQNRSLTKIGKHFNRHHATIIAGLKTIKGELEISAKRKKEYEALHIKISQTKIFIEPLFCNDEAFSIKQK